MTITERIEYDVQCLDVYFRQLFAMAQVASSQEFMPSDVSEESEHFIAHSVTAFIRPDMVCNVYSLVDFWLPTLCRFHESKGNLAISYKGYKYKGYKDIRNASDLDVYHKYLTKVAKLTLEGVQPSFDHLDNLRKVRNCHIHGGGHITANQRTEMEKVPDVTVFGSLVVITDSFVWESLKHAKTYLRAVAQA